MTQHTYFSSLAGFSKQYSFRMATSLVKIRTEKFYVISEDFTSQEFASLAQAFKSGGKCIVHQFWGQRDENDSRLTGFRYELFNEKKEKCTLESNHWKIEEISFSAGIGVDIYNHSYINCEISDPKGVVKKMTFGEGIQGLCESLKFVFETSELANWQHYELILENKELKERLAFLERKVTVMNSFMTD